MAHVHGRWKTRNSFLEYACVTEKYSPHIRPAHTNPEKFENAGFISPVRPTVHSNSSRKLRAF